MLSLVLSGKVPYIITSTFFIPKILRNCAILFEKEVLNIRAKRILTVSQCNCHQRNLRDVSVCSGFIIQTNWRLKKKNKKKNSDRRVFVFSKLGHRQRTATPVNPMTSGGILSPANQAELVLKKTLGKVDSLLHVTHP